MQLDDVKNSEYIEEKELKNSTAEQKQILFNSNIICDDNVKFEFSLDGGTGGATKPENLKTSNINLKLSNIKTHNQRKWENIRNSEMQTNTHKDSNA